MYYSRFAQRFEWRPNHRHRFKLTRHHVSFERSIATRVPELSKLMVWRGQSAPLYTSQVTILASPNSTSFPRQYLHSACVTRQSNEKGFFDYSERLFASITQLPASFFSDIDAIRQKSKEERNHHANTIEHEEQRLLGQPFLQELRRPGESQSHEDSAHTERRGMSSLNATQPLEYDYAQPRKHVSSVLSDDKTSSSSRCGSLTDNVDALDQESTDDRITRFKDRWPHDNTARRGKLDLSYRDALHCETPGHGRREKSQMLQSKPSSFRANAGLRLLTRNLMNHISMRSRSNRLHKQSQMLCVDSHAVTHVFSESDLKYLHKRQYDIGDVLSWAWILIAPSALSIRRFVAFSQWQDQNRGKVVPLFVSMQILRSENIDAQSLDIFLSEIARLLSSWTWRGSSIHVLIVRLLRHSRQVAPPLFPRIIQLAQKLLQISSNETQSLHTHTRLTHFLNRLLSLLALPSPHQPFRSMIYQQESQLDLVRHMQTCQPQIPINREGYRALTETQLMHAKTHSERQWAHAKGPSWPPWPPLEQMGQSNNVDYAGKKSRVMKVLHRMRESGYGSHEADVAAQVLSGWDTDLSPTIQTRQLANSPSTTRPWLPGNVVDYTKLPTRIWTARVMSTRSAREAWMCFCAYTGSVEPENRKASVYHAMLKKLWASTAETYGHLPGDGREVHPDPSLPRNLVYIPESIPTARELYQRMKQDGIKPDMRLLSGLLDHATSMDQGFHYIEDSKLPANTKTVLQNKSQVSNSTFKESIAGLPEFLKASILHMLCRRHGDDDKAEHTFQKPCTKSSGSQLEAHHSHSQNLSSIEFALGLLELSDCKRTILWNNVLRGLRSHAYPNDKGSSRYGLAQLWRYTCTVLNLMHTMEALPDLHTFREVGYIAVQVETWLNPKNRHIQQEPLPLVRGLFLKAISPRGTPSTAWITTPLGKQNIQLPSGDDIEMMVWCIGAAQNADTIDDILKLLGWLFRHHDNLHNESRKIRRQAMVAVRVFLQGCWASETCKRIARVQKATNDQILEAERLCIPFDWASDEEMSEYLKLHSGRFKRVETKLVSRVAKDAEQGLTRLR